MLALVVKITSNHFNFWLILNLRLMILRENNLDNLEEERLANCFSEQENTKVNPMFNMYTEIDIQWNII